MKWGLPLVCMPCAVWLLLAGCAPDDQQTVPPTDAAAVEDPAPPKLKRGTEKTADQAVRDVVAGMRAKRPEAVWDFLPPSYRRDVNELVRDFANRMDPELWNRTFASARRLTGLLRTKKELILNHPRVETAEQINVEELQQSWDGLVDLIDTLAASEISDLENLKQFDGRTFLAQTGGRAMNQLEALSALTPDDTFTANLEKLGAIEATLLNQSADGKEAVVRLESPDPQDEPREVPFVLVEGQWIPRDLAEQWQPTLANYRTQMLDMTQPEAVQQSREQILPILNSLDATIAQLEKAETQEAFNAVVQKQILGPLQFLFGPPAKDRPPQPQPPSKQKTPAANESSKSSATVVVRGKIADEAAVEAALRQAGAADVTTFSDGEATRFAVTNVMDVASFARQLTFGKVVAVDPQTRTITIEADKATEPQRNEPSP